MCVQAAAIHSPLELDKFAVQVKVTAFNLSNFRFSFLPSFCGGREEFSRPTVQGVGVELEGTTRR